MKVQELPVKDWLEHLRRHRMPEIMDDTCMDALKSVRAQYGDVISHGAGQEVRLGEEARYADYIMSIDTEQIPFVESLWYEIDYAEFRKAAETGGKIEPCLFANIDVEKAGGHAAFWDAVLPPFMGERRAARLRAPLDRVIAALPEGAQIKQIGTMSSRGELDIMRLVIMFPRWESIAPGLAAIGWPGNTEELSAATKPWKEIERIAVNIDLGENGVLPKVGIEGFSRWRHPLLVDKFLARLEDAGLCLKSKADALRRWIRIRPDGDPFIQTLISYFKLVYKDGKIVEAKAYLEQSPYIHHHYFHAYQNPVRIDIELDDGKDSMHASDVMARIRECKENRVSRLRFIGGENYEQFCRLLSECRANGFRSEVVLAKNAERDCLSQIIEAGADSVLVDVGSADDPAVETLRMLNETGFPHTRVRWFLHKKNADTLPQMKKLAESLGAEEFIVTGMKLCEGKKWGVPSREQIATAAEFIRPLLEEKTAEKSGEKEETEGKRMTVSVESCFSPLAAYIGGENPKQNSNRGIQRGCEAGRSFFAIRADGTFSPCLCLHETNGTERIADYWKQDSVLAKLREEEMPESCESCPYDRRCLPCPAMRETGCPLAPV